MQLSASKRNLGRIAGILGLLQGLAWAGMSLAAIVLHNWSPNLDETDPTYTRFIGLLLYNAFIRDNNLTNFVVRTIDFQIFMWIYFILSVGWAAVSIDQLTAIHFNKGRQKFIIFTWGVVTLITCLIDLIFTCLLARDYANCYKDDSEVFQVAYFCYLAVGIVMTIAARGYSLWFINVILSFSMLYTATKIKKKDKLANYFSDHSIPRVTIPRPANENIQQRGGDASLNLEPNFLNNESPYPSFLYQDKFNTREDTLTSGQSRRSKTSDSNIPPFLSRGEKFSY